MAVINYDIPKLTYNDVPEFLGRLYAKVENLERILSERDNPTPETAQWLDLIQLCNYLPDNPAPQTVYGKVSAKEIPYYKTGKKLRFLKSEIDQWLLNGRRKTTSETAKEADNYLASKRAAK